MVFLQKEMWKVDHPSLNTKESWSTVMKDYKGTFNIKNRVMAASCFNFAMAVKNFGMLNS